MDPRVLKATSVKAEDPAAQSPEPQALKITAASSNPKMFTLPWEKPLATWPEDLLVNLPRGISRHVVRFVHVGDEVYAMKEITRNVAEREYELLRRLQKLELPTVQPIAVVTGRHNAQGEPLEAILVTKHLKFSLPYRALFARNLRPDTAERLIDALAVLMVRLHLAGFYWGDVSLSNVLFLRDADAFSGIKKQQALFFSFINAAGSADPIYCIGCHFNFTKFDSMPQMFDLKIFSGNVYKISLCIIFCQITGSVNPFIIQVIQWVLYKYLRRFIRCIIIPQSQF